MPFFVITGTFPVVGSRPDGDSVHFKPDNLDNWNLLDGVTVDAHGADKIAQIRLEGIDALETHHTFQYGTREYNQPLELAYAARDRLLKEIGVEVTQWGSGGRVITANEGIRGYILSRATDEHGRPLAYLYAGSPPVADGKSFRLEVGHLRSSVNHKLLTAGLAYPLYYNGLFPDLRSELTSAVTVARGDKLGIWPRDKTNIGVDITSVNEVIDNSIIMPKLFRRIAQYMDAPPGSIIGFKSWLELRKENILRISDAHFTHLDTYISQSSLNIKLTELPENLVFYN